jgi:hypothetical protein
MRRGFPCLVGLIPVIAAAACGSAAGTLGVSTATHGPGVTPADGAIAYVLFQNSGTVTPIRTATNTPLTAIKVGRCAYGIAIAPDGNAAYVLTHKCLRARHTPSSGFGPAPLAAYLYRPVTASGSIGVLEVWLP